MQAFKRFSSNYSIYIKISFQLILFFVSIYIVFQLLIKLNFFNTDTLNVIHKHYIKLNILLLCTFTFVFIYILNRINKWFIKPLQQLKNETNKQSDIFNNKSIHGNDAGRFLKNHQVLVNNITNEKNDKNVDLPDKIIENQADIHQLQLTLNIFNNSQDIIIFLDNNGIITHVNPIFCHLIGINYENIIKQPLINFINTHTYKKIRASLSHELNNSHQWQGEFNIQNMISKKKIPLYVKINKLVDNKNNLIQYSIIATDLTTIKEIDRLVHINHHDSLTELPNRIALTNRLNDELKIQLITHHIFAVLFIDLDSFKVINDNYGHQMGDKVLKITANKLRNAVKKSDMIARLSGDEFIAIINPVTEHTDVIQTCKRILKILQQPIIIDQHHLAINASIGCYYAHPNMQQAIDDILSQADIAMYQAKMAGKGCLVECNSF